MTQHVTRYDNQSIRDLRHQLGLSQEQFAQELGVTLSTVSRWELGRSQPSRLALLRLHEISIRVSAMDGR